MNKKMKSKLTLILVLTIVTLSLQAQRKVALQSNGTTTIFAGPQPFVDAYNTASSGDTIYLPGGTLISPTVYDKSLTIFGTGIRVDSTQATDVTKISYFTLQSGASKFHIEGVYVDGTITFQANQKVDSVLIKRCFIKNDISITGTNTTPSLGVIIQENVILGQINAQYTDYIVINNNIGRFISNVKNGHIYNNIFNSVGNLTQRILTSVSESLIENNRISNEYNAGYIINNCYNNTFNNNVFNSNPTTDGTNTWNNNYINVVSTDLFVNYIWPFSEDADYTILNPALYQGTTGNVVGIYGGYKPSKIGALPINPHIQYKNIAPQTNLNGELQIEIKVAAQNE
jgi:hypothetical protein